MWAIPVGVDPLVMYYNRDLFDEAGALYPRSGWTWEDFLDAAVAVNDPEASVFGYISTPRSADPLTFIYEHGGQVVNDLQNPTRTTFDDPLTIEAVQWYVDLIYEYNVVPTPLQRQTHFGGNEGIFYGIAQNKVGMWVGAISERDGMAWRRQWNMEWGVAALPRDVRSITLTDADGYFISSHTQHHEACWRWIVFLGERTHWRLMPARWSLLESEEYEREIGSEIATAVRDSLKSAVEVSPRLAGFSEVLEEVFFPAIEDVIEERATPEEAMASAQRQAEAMLGP